MTKLETVKDEARSALLDPEAYGIAPGMTIHTVLRHVSASGMTRWISPLRLVPDGAGETVHDLTYMAGRLLGYPRNGRHEGLKVGGCGSDMGFEVVYSLGRALFPNGYECTGPGCNSNDHANGDRDYSPHTHKDGGYALKHRWI